MLADNQAEIDRLHAAINGQGPDEFFRQTVQIDAAKWVARIFRLGADLGLASDAATPILLAALNEIRAAIIAADRIEPAGGEGSTRKARP